MNFLNPYDTGNTEHTIEFVRYMQDRYPKSRLLFIWDGATYHKSEEFKKWLHLINDGYEENDRPVTCMFFAPNAPDQNPVEDIWLKGKNFLRSKFLDCNFFSDAVRIFEDFLDGNSFDFPKLSLYGSVI